MTMLVTAAALLVLGLIVRWAVRTLDPRAMVRARDRVGAHDGATTNSARAAKCLLRRGPATPVATRTNT